MSVSKARIMFLASVLIYGTLGPIVRFIDVAPEVLVLFRGTIGCVLIGVVIAFRGQGFDFKGVRANLGWLLATGLCLGSNWITLFTAYKFTSVAVASVCNYLAPVIVVLLAPVVFHEKISPFKFACVGAALIGVVLVSGVLESARGSFDPRGVGLGLLSALAFVGIVICNRFVSDIDSFSRVFIQLGVAALVALGYVLVVHKHIPLPSDVRSVVLSVLLGLVHTGLAYILWFGAQPFLPLQEIALLGYLEPVMSVVLSALVLGEPLTALGMCGAALVLGAAAVSELG